MSKRIQWHLEEWDTNKLKPYDKNPRIITELGLKDLEKSFEEIGFAQPVNINLDGTILSGHARYQQLKKEGAIKIPVYMPDRLLTPKQEEAVIIRMNKNIAGDWDFDSLANNFEVDDLLEWGFTEDELDFSVDIEEIEGHTDPDDVPEVEHPITVKGDVWLLGEHRVMCGDSTMIDEVDKLMNGQKADMVFTDPPYGVNYEGGHFHSGDVNVKRKREKLANDSNDNIYSDVISVLSQFVDGPCYTWFADTKPLKLFEEVNKIGQIHSMIVWHKTNATYAALNAQYKQRHEVCLYWKPKKSTLRWCGETTENTMWEMKKDSINNHHPTQKPVALAERAIGNHNAKSCLDLFLGSGSTLIACEKTNRKCYGMELDEKYVDVIINRWQNYTKKDAILESTGETYNQMKVKRGNG